MKRGLQSFFLMAFMLLVGSSAWALTPDLSMDYELSGYKAAAFYDFSTNAPAVLPESGDLRFRSDYGLFNFGAGNRGGDVSISVKQGQVLVCQFADTQGRGVTINSISGCTKSSMLIDGSHLFYVADEDKSTLNFNVGRGGCIVSLLVMDEDQSVTKASYTLNYINGELAVKSVNGEMAVGASLPTDASFFVEDAKYFRAAGEPESFTIAEGENNFSVKVRPAETFNYSLVSSRGGATLASGSGLEGETVYVGYPRYQLSEGKFYEAAPTKNEYRKTIALTKDNVSATVDYEYEWNGSNDIVFYAEGENIDGFTVSTAGNIPVRASNAKAGTAAEDVTITTLPAGKYKLHVGIFTSKSAFADQVVNFGIGSETFAAAFTGVNLNEITSDEITVTENSDVKFIAEGSWADAQFDYIYIEQTEYVPVVYTVNIAEGIVGGTVVADPTSAKAGDEVTVTATPAEGYELAGISVTCVKSDEAIIVTDGKFTMPADDVTVNATFQKKEVIYIETDLTAKFNSLATTQWTGSSGQVGWAAPKVKTNSGLEVAAWERYDGSCDWTGDIMSSSVTGLVPGTYKIELYGAAAFTYGRGFGSTAFTGDFSKEKSDTYKDNESIDENTGVTLYAETAEGKVSKEIPIWYATNFNTSGIATATLENVIVGESGEIKIGLSKTSTSTNWHVVQLKGVTAQVPAANVLADAVEAAKAIAESDVPAVLYSRLQQTIADYDKEYTTADGYKNAISAINSMVDIAKGYMPLSAVLNEGDQYKANVPAENPAIAAYDQAIADVKGAYDGVAVADIPAAVKVVEAALPALAKAQTAPGSDMTRAIVNPTINGVSGWTCDRPKGGGGPELPAGGALEYWAGSANPRAEASFDYYQVIEGLPSGKYIISAEMYNSLNGEEGAVFAPTSGVYASSGNDETATLVDVDGTEYIRYATEPVFVKDGTLRLGIKNTELPMAARWFVADNFTLTLVETIPTYEVNLAEPQNGAIEVSAAVAAENDKVIVIATPNEGYELESVSVKGVTSDIAVQVVTDEVTGEMSFTMPNDAVVVSATFKSPTGIDAASAAKGMKADGKYLKNGKVIIIKNGKEYSATGAAK